MKNIEGVLPNDFAKKQIEELRDEEGQKHAELADSQSDTTPPGEVLQFAEDFLRGLERNWRSCDLPTKKRIQEFFYPRGATVLKVAGRTTKTEPPTGGKTRTRSKLSATVGHGGIEPPTHGLRVRCSTAELMAHQRHQLYPLLTD